MKLLKSRVKEQRGLNLKFRGKKYSFSTRALILFPVGILILAASMLRFFEITEIVWLQELFAKFQVFFLNLFFNLGAQTNYLPLFSCPWHTIIPGGVIVYINNGCTGLPAMSIFVSVIIFTPHSQDPKTKEDILWRKTIAITAALVLIFFFNVLRAVIQFYLYSRGFAWSLVHDSQGVLAIIIVVHIAIFLFCVKYLPEWYVSIYYSLKLIYRQLRKERIVEFFYKLKHRVQIRKRGLYSKVKRMFINEGMDLTFILKYEIDSRVIKFLYGTKYKYTAKAIKNRLFSQQEKITEDLIERILEILVNADIAFSEIIEQKTYYFI
jgi:exosortase/archaeosortase family protein